MIICARLEKGVIDIDTAGTGAETRNKESLIYVASVVAAGARNADASRRFAEDFRRIEKHVAVSDHEQLALIDTALFEVQDEPW